MAHGNRANRSIGGAGLEQGGPNLGNDYSRDITREVTSDDSERVVVPHNKQENMKANKQKKDKQPDSLRNSPNWKEDHNNEFDD